MTDPSDIQLMEGIARRETTALRSLYDRYARVAFALAYRIIGEARASEEVVQETFEIVWHKGRSIDVANVSNVRTWLLAILQHRALDQRRRKTAPPNGQLPPEHEDRILVSADCWPDVPPHLLADQARMALRNLPPDQRRAIEMAWFEGLPHGAIAQRERVSLGIVRERLRLGLRELTAALESALLQSAEEGSP